MGLLNIVLADMAAMRLERTAKRAIAAGTAASELPLFTESAAAGRGVVAVVGEAAVKSAGAGNGEPWDDPDEFAAGCWQR